MWLDKIDNSKKFDFLFGDTHRSLVFLLNEIKFSDQLGASFISLGLPKKYPEKWNKAGHNSIMFDIFFDYSEANFLKKDFAENFVKEIDGGLQIRSAWSDCRIFFSNAWLNNIQGCSISYEDVARSYGLESA